MATSVTPFATVKMAHESNRGGVYGENEKTAPAHSCQEENEGGEATYRGESKGEGEAGEAPSRRGEARAHAERQGSGQTRAGERASRRQVAGRGGEQRRTTQSSGRRACRSPRRAAGGDGCRRCDRIRAGIYCRSRGAGRRVIGPTEFTAALSRP